MHRKILPKVVSTSKAAQCSKVRLRDSAVHVKSDSCITAAGCEGRSHGRVFHVLTRPSAFMCSLTSGHAPVAVAVLADVLL